MLNEGDQLHVITRRGFAEEGRRHFVGRVLDADDGVVKLEGYSFLFEATKGRFERVSASRTRLFSLLDAANVFTVIPADVDIASIQYTIGDNREIVLTDGVGFSLQLSELTRH